MGDISRSSCETCRLIRHVSRPCRTCLTTQTTIGAVRTRIPKAYRLSRKSGIGGTMLIQRRTNKRPISCSNIKIFHFNGSLPSDHGESSQHIPVCCVTRLRPQSSPYGLDGASSLPSARYNRKYYIKCFEHNQRGFTLLSLRASLV